MPTAPGGTLAAMADKQALGAYGEKLAAQYLRESGMEIVARNWRCRYGELDLIVQDPQITAFVEVKTRSGLGFGLPAESVTFSKSSSGSGGWRCCGWPSRKGRGAGSGSTWCRCWCRVGTGPSSTT